MVDRSYFLYMTIQPETPLLDLVEVNGFEPMTSWMQTRRSPN
jgi:hypothetical protein